MARTATKTGGAVAPKGKKATAASNKQRKTATTNDNAGKGKRQAGKSKNSTATSTAMEGGRNLDKGARLSFGSAIDSDDAGESMSMESPGSTLVSTLGGGGGGGHRSASSSTITTSPSIAVIGLGNNGNSIHRRPSYAASLLRAMSNRPSPGGGVAVGMKRPRPVDPFLEEEGQEEEALRLMATPPRGMGAAAKKARGVTSSPVSPPRRRSAGSMGISSLSLARTPTAQIMRKVKKNNQQQTHHHHNTNNTNEEEESELDTAPTTVRRNTQPPASHTDDNGNDPHSRDEADPLDHTPDKTVQAILTQEPPTATRAARLMPGHAPPSPVSPLWSGNHNRNNDNVRPDGVAASSPIIGRGSSGRANANEEEEEIDIFAMEWSPLSAPRRSGQQQEQGSMVLVNGDENEEEDEEEEEEEEVHSTVVAPRHLDRRHAIASTTAAAAAVATRLSFRSHSVRSTASNGSNSNHRHNHMRTVSVSIRPRSRSRSTAAAMATAASARNRSVNLLDAEGLHEDELEPFFVGNHSEGGSAQESFITADSFEAMMTAVEGKNDTNTNANAISNDNGTDDGEGAEQWVSLTREAAELEGQGLALSRSHGARRNSNSRNGNGHSNSAAAAATASDYTWARGGSGSGRARTPLAATQPASQQQSPRGNITANSARSKHNDGSSRRRQLVDLSASGSSSSSGVSAKTQRMIEWAEEARRFFRFIDERQVIAVSPLHNKSTAAKKTHHQQTTSASARCGRSTSTVATPSAAAAAVAGRRTTTMRTPNGVSNSNSISGRRVSPVPNAAATAAGGGGMSASRSRGASTTVAASVSARRAPSSSASTAAPNTTPTPNTSSSGFAAMIARAKQRAMATAPNSASNSARGSVTRQR